MWTLDSSEGWGGVAVSRVNLCTDSPSGCLASLSITCFCNVMVIDSFGLMILRDTEGRSIIGFYIYTVRVSTGGLNPVNQGLPRVKGPLRITVRRTWCTVSRTSWPTVTRGLVTPEGRLCKTNEERTVTTLSMHPSQNIDGLRKRNLNPVPSERLATKTPVGKRPIRGPRTRTERLLTSTSSRLCFTLYNQQDPI